MNARTWSTVKKMPTHGHAIHTVSLSFYSIFIAFFFPSTLFHLVSVSPYCSLSLHGSTPFFTTHSHRGNILILLKGLHLIFISVNTFQSHVQSLLLTGADARGWFHFKTCGSGIFQTCTEGSEGYFRVQRHVFKLDMTFNYFVVV